MAQIKTILSCRAVQLVWFTKCKHYPSQCSFHTYTKMKAYNFKCLKYTHNYFDMRLYLFYCDDWSQTINFCCVQKNSCFICLHCGLSLMPLSIRQSSVTSGYFLLWKNWLSLCPWNIKARPHWKLQAHFGIGPPTFRSSNYSSYKTSTLLLVKPQYNNTTKHFKEATHISREK